jgi:signal transduction histidine kinase
MVTATPRGAGTRAGQGTSSARPVAPRRLGSGHARLAWVLAGVSVLLAAAGLVLLARNGSGWAQAHPDDAVNGIVYPVVGALILARRRGHRIGWLFVVIGLPMSTAIAAAQYSAAGLPGADLSGWIARWVWLLGVPVIPTVVVLLFPDGELPSPRWRPVLWTGIVGIGLLVPAIAFLPEQDPTAPANPYAIAALAQPLRVVAGMGFVLLGAGSLGALASLVVRYRTAEPVRRLQLRWFLAAACVVVFAVVLGNFVPVLGPAIQLVAFPLIALATATAILRHRLYGIDAAISTSLVWASLSACVLGGYLAMTALAGGLLPGRGGIWPAVIATAAVAVGFQPLRARLQSRVDRLVYGDRFDPAQGLRRLGDRLEGTIALDAVLPTVVAAIADALRAPAVELELHHEDGWLPGARHGSVPADPVVVPLWFRGEPVGRLRIASRVPGEEYTPEDHRLLEDLARQASVAVHAVQVTTALQHSREQLVGAREGERRRLRRDLHDEIGPSLAALSLGLAASRNLIPTDPHKAVELLRQLETETAGVVTQLRRVVEGLRPPQLDDLGLEGALAARTAALSSPTMTVTLHTSGPLPDLPAATEVAAYRIVNEAVSNAVRHSGGTHCTVRLHVDDVLTIETADDGHGLAHDRKDGIGLPSIKERVDELGGTLRITSTPGEGTRVLATLPCKLP